MPVSILHHDAEVLLAYLAEAELRHLEVVVPKRLPLLYFPMNFIALLRTNFLRKDREHSRSLIYPT